MSADLTARLEAAVARLEQYASGLSSAAPAGSSGSAAVERKKSNKLLDYEDYVSTYIAPFIAATAKFPELEKIGAQAKTAFDRFGDLIDAESVSKKPDTAELIKFLDPVVQVMNAAGSEKAATDSRNPFYNQFKAWAEATQAFAWPTMGAGAREHVQATLESSEFYLNKVLTKAKQDGGPKEKDAASFAQTLKASLKFLSEYLSSSYRSGLEWNAKGASLSSFTPAGTTTASESSSLVGDSAPPPPPGPAPDLSSLPPPPTGNYTTTKAKPTGEAGMSAVFDSIRGATTSGLKRVTDDMKTHKNPNLRAANTVPAASAAPAASSKTTTTKVEKVLGPPTTELRKGTWWVENHTSGTIELKEVQLKESVYITHCSNCTITIANKVKSIGVDACKRLQLEFSQVLSLLECVNSQNCKLECSGSVPSVQIDKSSGISIVLLARDAVAAVPGIVTSNTSELNLVVPGKTDEDDPIEIPLPEQYVTRYNPATGKLTTTPADI